VTVIAWLWARTVRSPDPRAKGAMVPLVVVPGNITLLELRCIELWHVDLGPAVADPHRSYCRVRATISR
jgi:hypothetical protein